MSLYDLLACPLCKSDLARSAQVLRCSDCGREYPIVQGVPVLLPDPSQLDIVHEGDLMLREGYDPWIYRMILQSLTDNQVAVDAGCGNMRLDDPCLIRMDVKLTPYVDLVADLHAMPFKAESLDYVFSLAVVEHLRQPFVASAEMSRVLKPGGYLYGDCNFVFPYHGFPHHYFNASIHGLKQVFAQFRQLRAGVAPFQMPSFAVESLLETYLSMFHPETPIERAFVRQARHLLDDFPLHDFDARFPPDAAFRIAAGTYFAGIKQPGGSETVLPPPVMDAYAHRADLRAAFPDPYDLTVPHNLMVWARGSGRAEHPDIARYFDDLPVFSKYADPMHPWDRSTVQQWPAIPHPDDQRYIAQEHIQRQLGKALRTAWRKATRGGS